MQPECLIRIPASDSVSVFPKAWIKLLQNRPGSDQDVLVRVWPTHPVRKQAGVQGISVPVSGRTQTGPLPVSPFQARLRSSTDVPDRIVQNQPGSDLVLADCVRVWPNGLADCVRVWPNGLADCVRVWPNGLTDCVRV